jgi:Flp pilus assembly protein TadG
MRWLTMRLHRAARAGRDRGATAVLVAILLPVVLLGVGAFVLDVGSWYSQRAQTQNGADAGAQAVAQTCANGACDLSAATGYAPSNSTGNMDTSAQVTTGFPCGRDTVGHKLPTCPAGTENGTICPAAPASGNYVDVATNTLSTKDGTTLVPPLLGKALRGKDYQGQTIGACAQASWGDVGAADGLAMTISYCNWDDATADGTTFAPAPPYSTWPPPGVAGYSGKVPDPGVPGGEQVLQTHGSGNDCVGGPGGSGWQLPGGFGWLSDPGNDCTSYVDVNGTYYDDTGNDTSAACTDRLADSRTNHTVLYIPVYDGLAGTGSNGYYHLKGFAAFVVTGGWLNGQGGGFKEKSTITGKNYCSGSQRCVYGFFTQALVPNAAGGGDLPGANYVKLTG